MTTDTSERGLESLICAAMTGADCDTAQGRTTGERPSSYGVGWVCGDPRDYDRDYCVDLIQLAAFLDATQPNVAELLALGQDGPTRQKFLARLQGEISKRGTIDVLRKGVKHGPHQVDLFYGTPSPGNEKAKALYGQNRFSVTRQLQYSRDNAQLALDLGLFINGLPVATFELKNSLTKQTVEDAVEQYKRTRNPHEKLFELGRCLAHFAVDDHEVRFCTHLKGKESWFLPFNRGWDGGRGNPPNPNGLKTDFLWKETLTRGGLTDIIENYAQIVEGKDDKTGRKRREQIWPRYHQLDVVRKLLADVSARGAGRRYLVQHSAGSGKSNSIAWLAHQLIGLEQDGASLFDSVVVVTDRKVLDQQIRDTIKQFAQVRSIVGHAQSSGDLRSFLREGKKIVITTVQKFPFILDAIGNEHRGHRFGIIIDEAHSSQGGRTSASVSMALGEAGAEGEDETTEDKINRLMESKKLLPNASYFAFTATPKSKTLEIFGVPEPAGEKVRHLPFHVYSHETGDPRMLHHRRAGAIHAGGQLLPAGEDGGGRPGVRHQAGPGRSCDATWRTTTTPSARRPKSSWTIFHEQVLGLQKIGGQARAMVVTSSIERAVNYYHAIREYLAERKSPYQAIVAFSGEHEYGGAKVTEASLNGFSSNAIADRIQEDPYRFLVCADKFQTGYDEPLLHTMYVGQGAVRREGSADAVSPQPSAPQEARRVRARLHQRRRHDQGRLRRLLQDDSPRGRVRPPTSSTTSRAALDGYQVYDAAQVGELVERYLSGADRDRLDPILDICVAAYRQQLDEDGQVDFKGKAKAFLRAYGFLASILPYTNADWEKLSIFLTFLVPKLPAPVEEDLSKGILEAIDMDSYRVEKQAAQKVQLADEDAEIEPAPTDGGGQKPEPELDRLSNIIRDFNDRFGNIEWKDQDKIERVISEELPVKVAADKAYQNAIANSDKQNARIEHDKALQRAMTELIADHTELFKQFSDNESFRRWLAEMIFAATYNKVA